MTIKKRKFKRVVKAIAWIVFLSFIARYAFLHYHKPVQQVQGTQRELAAIMDSEDFKAKIDNLAQQQLLTNKIAQKKAAISQLENEQADLERQLEAKRVESLSL